MVDQVEVLFPRAIYLRLQRGYRLVFLAGLLGAFLGVVLGWMASPRFSATAVLNIGVDYSRSEWLDEDADRLALRSVQGLMLSDDALTGTLGRLPAVSDGAPARVESVSSLRGRLRVVRSDNRWELSATSGDPEQAARTANAWAEVVLEQLASASLHAWRVAQMQSLFFRVFCRPEAFSGAIEGSLWVCDEGVPSSEPAGIPSELIAEIEQSRGIIPALSFGWESAAAPPTESENGNRALMILGGMLVGLLVGTIAVAAAGDPPA
ncbi:MAG TPA: hypothetical protein VJK02_02645 [Anaerolineales bacterium]|nr:hypothetical protein [Anaerolineales bacterium]